MKIGLLSDTHGYLDPRVFDYFKDCDEIWHAGDFGTENIWKQLHDFKPFRGVYGNIDGQEIRTENPLEQFFILGDLKVLMIHIGGSPGHYYPEARSRILLHQPDLFVCGHSHILKVMHDKKYNLLYMNPGAAGKHGFHQVRTILRFELGGGKVSALEVIELGKRSLIESV